jgi:geranyl-CoA carboxylase alpha subunit
LKDASRARSPVAGKVTQVMMAAGDAVQEGQQLVCVEAMKMEMWLCAESAGTVKSVHAKTGDQVESGALLVELEINTQKEA